MPCTVGLLHGQERHGNFCMCYTKQPLVYTPLAAFRLPDKRQLDNLDPCTHQLMSPGQAVTYHGMKHL